MTNLDRIYAHLEKDLEDRRAGGEDCPECKGKGWMWALGDLTRYQAYCRPCNGTGKSPAITEAEEVLEACRVERVRVGRLLAAAKLGRDCAAWVDGWLVENAHEPAPESQCRLAVAELHAALAEYNAPDAASELVQGR